MSDPEKQNPKKQEQTVEAEDLVIKPDYITEQDPEEVVNNPAVTPQMLNDDDNLRSDLTRE